MATLAVVNNPFNPNDKTVTQIDGGLAIFHYINVQNEDIEYVASLNGQITEDFTHVLRQDDFLAVVPIPKGGGGGGSKNPLKTIAMLALAIVAPQAGAWLAGSGSTIVGGMIVSSSVMASFYAGAIMIGGGMLINAILPDPTPSMKSTNTALEEVSPTYSFGGGSNAREAGSTLPIMLGKARVTPPIIGSYLSLDGDNQYLNILMAVNDGKINSITDIEVNNQPLINFDNIDYAIALGENNQDALSGFQDSKTTVSLQRNLNQNIDATTYTTAGNTLDALEIVLNLPRGLYYVEDTGGYSSRTITVEIKYRKVGTTEWSYMTGSTFAIYEYTYTRTYTQMATQDDGEQRLTTFTETKKTNINYGSIANIDGKEYNYQSSKFIENKTITYNDITATYKTAKKIAFSQQNLEKGQYEVEVKRISAFDTNTRVANDLQLEYINEIVYDDFTYPNVALLAVKAMATDQLNGGFPTITCLVDNTLPYDASKPKSNPAWGCYDLLKREGIPDSDINLVKFQEWADYCDTEGFTSNLYLDTQMELQSALNMVSILGRATVVQMGSMFTPIVSNVVDTPTQGFLFTSGNIIDNSFQLDTIPYNDRANIIEVTYYDEDDNYKPKTVQVQSHDFDSSTKEIKSSISLYGCTKREIALRYAKFLLNQNRYISETITFNADIDSIACSVGDVIKVGVKYMTNTLADGRLKAVDENTITLDQEIELENGKNYELQIRTEDDEIKIFDYLCNLDQTTDVLTFSNVPTIENPKNVVFAFGLQETEATNLYRVTAITRATDQKRKIVAVEYNPTVYDDNVAVEVEQIINDSLTTNLTVDENLIKNKDGSITEVITISWQSNRFRNEIFVDNKKVGETANNYYEIIDSLISGNEYTIRVNETETTFYFAGKTTPPDRVKNFLYEKTKTAERLTWNPNTEIDLKGYVLRYAYGSQEDWNNAIDIGAGIITSNYYDGLFPKVQGVYTLMIKAIDTTGNLSEQPNYIVLNVGDEKIENLIENYNFADDWSGELINCEILDGKLIANNQDGLLYDLNDTDKFFDKYDSSIFYDGNYREMSYLDSFVATANGFAFINYKGTDEVRFYYRKDYGEQLYKDEYMYYKDDFELFYSAGDFNTFIGGFLVENGAKYTIKIEFPQTTYQTEIEELDFSIDVVDLYANYDDITIPSGGVTIQVEDMDVVKNVQGTIQSGGVIFKHSKSTNEITINIEDINGNSVGGICDLNIIGYKL